MKAIEPVNIWVNGAVKQANVLNLYVVNDDLKSSCTFYYALLKETETTQESPEPSGESVTMKHQEMLTQGNIVMSGEEYDDWNIEEDINQAAYVWAADKLSLTLA